MSRRCLLLCVLLLIDRVSSLTQRQWTEALVDHYAKRSRYLTLKKFNTIAAMFTDDGENLFPGISRIDETGVAQRRQAFPEDKANFVKMSLDELLYSSTDVAVSRHNSFLEMPTGRNIRGKGVAIFVDIGGVKIKLDVHNYD